MRSRFGEHEEIDFGSEASGDRGVGGEDAVGDDVRNAGLVRAGLSIGVADRQTTIFSLWLMWF